MKIALSALTLILVVISCTSSSRKMESTSMEPTISEGENIAIVAAETIKRQDIVAFNHNDPSLGKQTWVFRVIGVPGDEIEIKQGLVYINGNLSKEPYTQLSGNVTDPGVSQPEVLGSNAENTWNIDNYGPVTIPVKGQINQSGLSSSGKLFIPAIKKDSKIEDDYYFLLGDSRHDAYDSRFIGLISRSEITGVVKVD